MTRREVLDRLRRAGCVWPEDEADLLIESASDQQDLSQKTERRAEGEPLELIVGWAEFRGLRIRVRKGVFVPRHRTEFLAQQAVSTRPGTVVELCCGAGAISATILNELATPVELHAADIDPAAVELARSNLPATANVHLYTGDLFSPLPEQLQRTVDVVVANVPYVPTGELAFLSSESRRHEPEVAVNGGRDGLTVFARLVAGARDWLAPGGRVMAEVSRRQVPFAESIIARHGLRPETHQDENLGATVVSGVTVP